MRRLGSTSPNMLSASLMAFVMFVGQVGALRGRAVLSDAQADRRVVSSLVLPNHDMHAVTVSGGGNKNSEDKHEHSGGNEKTEKQNDHTYLKRQTSLDDLVHGQALSRIPLGDQVHDKASSNAVSNNHGLTRLEMTSDAESLPDSEDSEDE
uniref:RxLR effector protein n=1 Tax=Zooxanthella nutricula TaxID=1333877 RepID=A0A6U6IJG3_9DINO|mmetsp:Transcript_18201/g.54413  ORF Transcript_18201/g.54413 Transcript_18201/m.54413 type:complete len:151 (+) Transcript_18201:142-594(+)